MGVSELEIRWFADTTKIANSFRNFAGNRVLGMRLFCLLTFAANVIAIKLAHRTRRHRLAATVTFRRIGHGLPLS